LKHDPAIADGITVQDIEGGFPHSEILGSKPVRSSPKLIAAYHVLHRLLAPRHPPDALLSLNHSHYRCPPARRGWAPVRPGHLRPDRKDQLASKSTPRRHTHAPAAHAQRQDGFALHDVRQPADPFEKGVSETDLPDLGKTAAPTRWWSQTDSNRRHPACKAGALPTELWPLNWSNASKWWAWEDLNFRPHAYQARALTN
jgi:hypothetical protein